MVYVADIPPDVIVTTMSELTVVGVIVALTCVFDITVIPLTAALVAVTVVPAKKAPPKKDTTVGCEIGIHFLVAELIERGTLLYVIWLLLADHDRDTRRNSL